MIILGDGLIKKTLLIVLLILCMLPIFDVVIFRNGFFFYIYLVFYILFPGRLFRKRVFRIDNMIVANVLLDFYIGVFLMIFLFYISHFLKATFLIKLVPLFFTILELCYIIRLRECSVLAHNIFKVSINQWLVVLFIYFVLVVICLLFTNFSFPHQYSPIYSDRTYQISHIAGLATDDPFISMTVYGAELRYHIFYYIFLACSKIIFSYDAYILLNRFVVTHIPILFMFSLYLIFRQYMRRPLLCLYFMVIVIFNMLSPRYSAFIIHILSNHNSLGFAVPLFILSCYIIKESLDRNSISIKIIVLLSCFAALLTGIKGPSGLILVSATAFYIILFDRKKTNITLVVCMIIAFAMIFYFVLYSKNSGFELELEKILGNVSLGPFRKLYESFDNVVFKIIFKLLLLPFQLFLHFNIFIVPVIVYAFITILSFLKNSIIGFEYYTIVVCAGIFGGFVLQITGDSNLYFIYTIFPFVSMLSLRFLFDFKIYDNKFVSLVLIVFSFIFIPINAKVLMASKNSNERKGFIATKEDISEYLFSNTREELLTDSDIFDGYNYIKSNTNKNDLIATNLLYQNDNPSDLRQHRLAAFGERHVYLEGYQYAGINGAYINLDENIANNSAIFSNITNEDKYSLVRQLEISYVFYYKNVRDTYFAEDYKRFVPVFSNNSVSVYKVIYE